MAYVREAQIEKALVAATEDRGGIAYKLTVPGRINVPDRLLILPGGRLIFVECKAPGEKPRAGQRREHERLAALGCEVYVLDSTENAWIFDGGEPEATVIEPPAFPPMPLNKTCCNKTGCVRLRYASGLCLRHYREAKANGKV